MGIISGVSGAAAPSSFEYVNGGNTAVPSATPTNLNWTHGGGNTLFDYTDPLFPVPLVAGTYAIAANIRLRGAQQANKSALVQLLAQGATEQGTVSAVIVLANDIAQFPQATLTLVQFMPLTGGPWATVTHAAGLALDFDVDAFVQRLS